MKCGFARIEIFDKDTKKISYYTGDLFDEGDYYRIITYKQEEIVFRKEQVRRIFPIGGPGQFNTLKESGEYGKRKD